MGADEVILHAISELSADEAGYVGSSFLEVKTSPELGTIINAGLLIIAIAAAIIAFLEFRASRNKTRIEKACELAKFYADNVVWKISVINQIFLTQNIPCIAKKESLQFTSQEAMSIIQENNLFSEFKVKDLKDLPIRIDLERLMKILEFDQQLAVNFARPTSNDFVISGKDGKAQHVLIQRSAPPEILSDQAGTFIANLLNDLEWLCMNFTHEIADETVVYQSLHQTFLANIQALYFYIAQYNNKPAPDRFYTNIAKMYNMWKSKDDDKKRKLSRAEAKGLTHGRKY
jgi:hypothetical protein